MRIALLTNAEHAQLFGIEQELPGLFRAVGIHAEPVIWSKQDTVLEHFDALLFRSVWDYYKHAAAFRKFLDRVQGMRVLNPVDVVRWNMDKAYLMELERAGIPIIPSQPVPRTAALDLGPVRQLGWHEAVIKPMVSAGAHRTSRFTMDELAIVEQEFRDYARSHDLIVQEFMPEIAVEGEWSVVFFNRTYSHAVLKRPAQGDFRVQPRFGGITQASSAPPALIAQARAVLEHVQGPLLYTRVDGVMRNGVFLLMELELIEPWLFLDQAEDGIQRFVDATAEALKLSAS
ncbi:MAG: hypothetical protein IPK99_13430 [Flavobacteriales bacterium]|nr:hypothetical protein [Flavobacteriales bacterium]